MFENLSNRLEAVSHRAALGASVKMLGGTLSVAQSAAYSPSYLYQLFPTHSSPDLVESIPANPEYQIEEIESYSYMTNAALTFGSARGTRFSATAGRNRRSSIAPPSPDASMASEAAP